MVHHDLFFAATIFGRGRSSAYDPAMTRRARLLAAALAIVAVAGLTGCQAAGSFTRVAAEADTARWTTDAVRAAGSPDSTTKLSAFEACRSDAGFFTTTYEWRKITNVSVPQASQPKETAAIASAFVAIGWRESEPRGLVTLTGTGKRKGLITVQTAGSSALAIKVLSPCYH
jgi:hypothetical protein